MSHNVPDGLRYTKEDEWIAIDGNIATIGITDYAQDALSDIVYLELPEADTALAVEEVFGVVESVKAAADLYAPISGTVTEANEDLVDEPEVINDDPYSSWMIKMEMSDLSEADNLMSAAEYLQYLDERE